MGLPNPYLDAHVGGNVTSTSGRYQIIQLVYVIVSMVFPMYKELYTTIPPFPRRNVDF